MTTCRFQWRVCSSHCSLCTPRTFVPRIRPTFPRTHDPTHQPPCPLTALERASAACWDRGRSHAVQAGVPIFGYSLPSLVTLPSHSHHSSLGTGSITYTLVERKHPSNQSARLTEGTWLPHPNHVFFSAQRWSERGQS